LTLNYCGMSTSDGCRRVALDLEYLRIPGQPDVMLQDIVTAISALTEQVENHHVKLLYGGGELCR
jgi:hypothetical protein